MSINLPETLAELKATVDYINDLIEDVETFDFEDAVQVQDEAKRVQNAASLLARMIDGEMLKQLEAGSRDFGRRTFKRTKRYVKRHDQDVLVRLAIDQGVEAGVDVKTGEINPRQAAEAAARTVLRMFCSASSTAKVTVVEKLGVDRTEFESREFKGHQVSVFEEEAG